MEEYIESYTESKDGNLTRALEESFREEYYQGDQAFGCLSIGLDFDFANHEAVRTITTLKEEIVVIKEKLTMYNRNYELY